MRYRCPVCMYAQLPYPPRDYHICPCCSTEFGNDDADFSHERLREMWIAGGANWFFGRAPEGWNPWMQLLKAGLGTYLPRLVVDLRLQSNAIVRSGEIISSGQKLVANSPGPEFIISSAAA